MSSSRFPDAIERVKRWMRANGAGVLVENLAGGASPESLERAEKELGFALPAELRAMWSLIDGQQSESNGFIGSRDLFGVADALRTRASVRRRYIDGDFGILASTKHAAEWSEVGLLPAEVSDRWIAFAGRDSDYLLVNADTGRVFDAIKDVPPLSLRAPSITAWFETYAESMEAGRYTVEEGFGDCYLQGR